MSSSHPKLPSVALSIRQPWAWLIIAGLKDIENRSWPTRFRGPVLIHAAKAWGPDEHYDANEVDLGRSPVDGSALPTTHPPKLYQRGGIVGVAEIVDCVTSHASRWFVGEYGFVLANARPLPFMPVRGALGFFPASYQVAA